MLTIHGWQQRAPFGIRRQPVLQGVNFELSKGEL